MNKDNINSQISQINAQYNAEKEHYVQGKAPHPPSDRIDELRRLYRGLFTASNFTQKELENMLNEEHKTFLEIEKLMADSLPQRVATATIIDLQRQEAIVQQLVDATGKNVQGFTPRSRP